MRRFPAGVAVLTVAVDGQRFGITVGSLVSLSLEPPLISVSIGLQSSIYEHLRQAGRFAVNVLGEEQIATAQHFARSGLPPLVAWEGVPLHESSLPEPLIEGSLAWLACTTIGAARRRRPHDLRRVGRLDRARQRRTRADVRARRVRTGVIDAVVFDLDGLLIDSEHLWDEVREELARERGGRWHDGAQRDMMGMSSPEWSRYMHDEIGLAEPPEEINRLVVERMLERYWQELPLFDGAVEAVERLAARWPLGLASSSNRPLIDRVLELAGLDRFFRVTVSSEEVAARQAGAGRLSRGGAPAGRRAGARAAVEDSHNGIRSARAAGMAVVAIPNHRFPPGEDALADADVVLDSLAELTPEAVERADLTRS